jgi:hypothetical protein
VLLAYIDEIGETGAFVSRDHDRYNTSPAFGYAGFVIPENGARRFGAHFTEEKHVLFRNEVAQAEHPGRWEKKGASIFRPDTYAKYPQQLRVFNSLVRQVRSLGGHLFYYANEKPLGTPKQVQIEPAERERLAMSETLNRLARYADERKSNLLVMIDQINEKTRAERLPIMYGHIFGRAADYREMHRIVEPPMHVDSKLSSNVQFADWIAACLTRAIDYQINPDSPYKWITEQKAIPAVRGAFTHESKVHWWQRSITDLHQSSVFDSTRVLQPPAGGLAKTLSPADWRRIKAAAERASGVRAH